MAYKLFEIETEAYAAQEILDVLHIYLLENQTNVAEISDIIKIKISNIINILERT